MDNRHAYPSVLDLVCCAQSYGDTLTNEGKASKLQVVIFQSEPQVLGVSVSHVHA